MDLIAEKIAVFFSPPKSLKKNAEFFFAAFGGEIAEKKRWIFSPLRGEFV